jgi:hypothetical protein
MRFHIKIANQKDILKSFHEISDYFCLAGKTSASFREYRVHQGKKQQDGTIHQLSSRHREAGPQSGDVHPYDYTLTGHLRSSPNLE